MNESDAVMENTLGDAVGEFEAKGLPEWKKNMRKDLGSTQLGLATPLAHGVLIENASFDSALSSITSIEILYSFFDLTVILDF